MKYAPVLWFASILLLIAGGLFEVINEESLGTFFLLVGTLGFFYSLTRIFVKSKSKKRLV